ncbi:MAG: rod shape-determining protein MreC [Acidobacteria bacterium]|nr:rod shape-determining protein MreC [Acidobacteriota bacterium]
MGRYRNVSVLAAVIVLQVVGLAIQVNHSTDNRSSSLVRVWVVSAITPFEKAIVSVKTGAADIWHSYFYLRGVRQENRQLKERLEQLQLEQVRLEQDANQAHRLQALLGFKEQFIAKTLAAQVIGSSGSGQSRTVYIDKGSHDGIQPDMPVISADGVVGRVITVYKNTAQVLLLNDHESGAGSIIERSRVLGVTQGKATGELVIDKVMPDEDVQPGDKVLTSGGDLIFPKGLLIGTVARIQKGPEFLEIRVKPAAALSRLEEVLVILKKEERPPAASAGQQRASDILSGRLPSVPDKPAMPAGASASKPPAANRAGAGGADATGAVNRRAGEAGAEEKPAGTQNSLSTPPSAGAARAVKQEPGSLPASTADRPPSANQAGEPGLTGTGAVNTRPAGSGAQGKLAGTQDSLGAPPSGGSGQAVRQETGSLPASTPAAKAPDSTTSKPARKTPSQPTSSTDTPQ